MTTEDPSGVAESAGGLRSAVRRLLRRRYDLPAIVAQRSRAARWLTAATRRLYYPRSMVSRQGPIGRWWATNVKRELPTLHHFDVHLTDHCNLNCKGCLHFSSICEPSFVEPDGFADDMRAMASRLNVEQIFLLGGEPLLHPDVNRLVTTARRWFPRTRICLVTNGLLLLRMDEAFWRTLSAEGIVLVCEAYPIELPRDEIAARASQHGVELEWTGHGRFYKLPIDPEGAQDPAVSFVRCSGITNCPLYRDGRLYPCAYPPFIDAFTERFGMDGVHAAEADSISVRDNDGRAIMEFLRRPIPFCRHCDFDHFEEYEWARSGRSVDEWTVSA